MKKYLLISAGCASLSLGVIGIFVPLLPTTPFVLLSAACFLRSSSGLYAWITGHRVFGRYIDNYVRHRAVSRRSKVLALALMWPTIVSSAVFFTESTPVRILLLLIASAVSVHILRIKTLTRDMLESSRSSRDDPEPGS